MNFIEQNCVVEHNGQTFESGGAYRTGNHALVYVKHTNAGIVITDWHGNTLGTASILSEWKRHNKWGEVSRWRSYRVHLNDGTCWSGRHNSDSADALRIKRRDVKPSTIETSEQPNE